MNKHKLYLFFFGLLAFGEGVRAQSQLQPRTIHLNAMMQTASQAQASYRLELTPLEADKYKGVVLDATENLKLEGQYVERNGRYIEDGHFKYYFPNGSIESEGEYQAGVKVGHWKRFDFRGNRKPDRYYPPSSASMRRQSMNFDISTDN